MALHFKVMFSHCSTVLWPSILRWCSVTVQPSYGKGKGSFYIAQYPVRWIAQSALHFFAFPGRPVHSDTNSASPGSILVRQQLRAKTKSLTCPPLSIARYSFIQLSQLGPQWRERKCPISETVAKQDSNPGSLDCESGILPLSYRAPWPSISFDLGCPGGQLSAAACRQTECSARFSSACR